MRMRCLGLDLISLVNARAIASALSGLCRPVDRIWSLDSSCSCPRALYLYVRDATWEINSGSLGIEMSPSANLWRSPSNTSARKLRYFSLSEGLLEPLSPWALNRLSALRLSSTPAPTPISSTIMSLSLYFECGGNNCAGGVDDVGFAELVDVDHPWSVSDDDYGFVVSESSDIDSHNGGGVGWGVGLAFDGGFDVS